MGKNAYKRMGFKKMSTLGLFKAVAGKAARRAQSRAKQLNLPSNVKGDKFQYGGCLVVEKGGKETLLTYVQEGAPDHVENEDVIKALGIDLERVPHATPVA